MAAWHRSRRADIVLRATGLLLCWVSYAAISRLVAMHVPPRQDGVLGYGLAAIGFVAASSGGALTLLGDHLFDRIEVSERWRTRTGASVPSESDIEMDILLGLDVPTISPREPDRRSSSIPASHAPRQPGPVRTLTPT